MDEKFRVFFNYSGTQPGVSVTPGFDEAVVEIKNDDGRYQIIHVCRSNCSMYISVNWIFCLGFLCDSINIDKKLFRVNCK